MSVRFGIATSIVLMLLLAVAEGQSAIPQPSVLLDAAEQIYSDFVQNIHSYKLEGQKEIRLRMRGQTIDPSGQWQPWQETARWRVWRDHDRFIWDRTTADERDVYSFDSARYYCYVSSASSGLIQTPQALRQTDLPPCENAFYAIYPFDVPHFLRSPLAGGSWLTEEPYYSALRRFLSSLEVVSNDSGQTCILRIMGSRNLARVPEHLPTEIVFRQDRGRFIPYTMLLRRDPQEETEYRVISAQWNGDCWMPTEVRMIARRITASGKKEDVAVVRVRLRIYDINQPIPTEAFQFTFPPGTRVTDETGRETVVGVAWAQLAMGIGIAALAMLLVAGIIWYWRHRR